MLAELVLCFIACFILLVIAPLISRLHCSEREVSDWSVQPVSWRHNKAQNVSLRYQPFDNIQYLYS